MNWICHFFHDWCAWVDAGSTQVMAAVTPAKNAIPVAVFGRQERRCHRCNIVEIRTVKIA